MFTARQLDFDKGQLRKKYGVNLCMMVGIVVIVFYVLQTMPSTRHYGFEGIRCYNRALSSMKSVINSMSARQQTVSSSSKAEEKYPDAGPWPILVQNSENKEQCVKDLQEELKKLGSTVVVMIFADWCGHCHNMMKTTALGEEKIPVVMVNGDHLTESFMTENKVEYYPNVRLYDPRTNMLSEPKSIDEAVEQAREELKTGVSSKIATFKNVQNAQLSDSSLSQEVNPADGRLSFLDDLF